MMSIRIAYVFDQLLPSSSTDTEQALCTTDALCRTGAAVTLFLPRHALRSGAGTAELAAYYDVGESFEVCRLRSTFPSIRLFEKWGHAFRAAAHRGLGDFDIVYTRNVPTLLSSVARGLPSVYETYRPWPAQVPAVAPIFRRLFSRPNMLGAILHSHYASEQFRQSGIDSSKLFVAHNGFDPRRFHPALSKKDAREALGLPAEGRIAAYVGRVAMAKGLDRILEMARAAPDILFLLVGSESDDGPVERAASALPNIRVFPWQSFGEIPKFLFAADVLLIPPTLGPLRKVGNTVLPIKVFQYLAAGRAILAPTAPDTSELLKHDVNAFLVNPDDIRDANRGLAALAGSDDLLDRLGEGAARLAETLTWDARAERILDCLTRMLDAASS